jgi:hypothetical protein
MARAVNAVGLDWYHTNIPEIRFGRRAPGSEKASGTLGSVQLTVDDGGLIWFSHSGSRDLKLEGYYSFDFKSADRFAEAISNAKASIQAWLRPVPPRQGFWPDQLSTSLSVPLLEEFDQQTKNLPRSTEAERFYIQRVGQQIFRTELLAHWERRCPLTGISNKKMLRASHIVPWAKCDDDAHRLDVNNGLLLSSLWDSAFDAGLVSFDDAGKVLLSPTLSAHDRDQLLKGTTGRIKDLKPQHLANLARHRRMHKFE